jgi:protein-disulfide isomerase
MSKQFWGVLVVIVLIFVGVLVFNNNGKNNTNNSSSGSGKLSEHIEGEGQSGVTLVEYGDYECPYCEEYYPIVKQVQQEFNTQIYFQFRNFPLVSIHQNAFAGARAAEAAALQGKFWEMHDALYDSSDWQVWSTSSNPTPYFNQYAQELGLNVSKFKTDFAGTQVDDTVTADMNEGNKLGIDGTPTFYLDGKQISPQPTVASFESFIKPEITKKEAAKAASTSSSTTKQ